MAFAMRLSVALLVITFYIVQFSRCIELFVPESSLHYFSSR